MEILILFLTCFFEVAKKKMNNEREIGYVK